MNHLLVLRVGYMERYDGPATIKHGGAYVSERGVGGEVFNFKPSRGKCYGYAMSRHWAGLNLRLLDESTTWNKGDELQGVDVVFIARKPKGGQVVIGWYKNAAVFHKQYRTRRGKIPGMTEERRHFLCVSDAENVVLLPEDERTFEVPYAPNGHKGFPGQSNVWYPEQNAGEPGVGEFIKRLRKFVATSDYLPIDAPDEVGSTAIKKGRGAGKPDHAHNAAVEAAAVNAVWRHYEAAGYRLQSVETEYRGWDLEAHRGKETLRIEVKGVSNSAIYFELTPNEYSKLKLHAHEYRVCVVCDALDSPKLYELAPKQEDRDWYLLSRNRDVRVPLIERVAAIGVEGPKDGDPA